MRTKRAAREKPRWGVPFLAGMVTAGAGMMLLNALGSRRRLVDPRLIRRAGHADGDVPPAVIIPGIMGSGLARPDETRVWLNLRNAVGQYNLSLPFVLPLSESRDDLRPGIASRHRTSPAAHVRVHRVLRPPRAAGGGGLRARQEDGGQGPRPSRVRLRLAARPRGVRAAPGRDAGGPGRRPRRPRHALQHRRPQHGRPHRALLPPLRDRGADAGHARHLGGRAPHQQHGAGGGARTRAASTPWRRCSTATASVSPTPRWPRP